jgi:hypothetical protein
MFKINSQTSLHEWGVPPNRFPTHIRNEETTEHEERRVVLKNCYSPRITDAELSRGKPEDGASKERLQLRLEGYNLSPLVLEKCNFNFGFPFAQNPEHFKVGTPFN